MFQSTRNHNAELVSFLSPRVSTVLLLLFILTGSVLAHSEQEETQLRIKIDGRRLELRYETKFPRSGSFARLRKMDRDGDETYTAKEKEDFLTLRSLAYRQDTRVTLDDQAVSLNLQSQEARITDTMVGLKELTVVYLFQGELPREPEPGARLTINDPAFGWNEVELEGAQGELSGDIPGDVLTLTFGSEASSSSAGPNDGEAAQDDKLLSLVSGELTPKVILWTLGLAFVLGALHALTPGHGKTMVAAYLVGSRGTVGQAILLGIVVTVTHTASVFLLGLGCMFAFQYVVPEKIIPWLGFLSGLLITGVGIALIYARSTGKELFHGHSHENGHGHSHLSGLGHAPEHSHSHSSERNHSHDHEHSHSHSSEHSHSHAPEHGHSHDSRLGSDSGVAAEQHESESAPQARETDDLGHSHTHSHASESGELEESRPVQRSSEEKPEKVSLWALISLGISGGMVPCPEALMVLLGAISLNRLLLGMAVLASFSAGLASLLILIGILVVTASSRVNKKYYPSDDTIKKISIAAYSFICILGLAIAVRSLTSAGILVINL
jgi:nickel/cobalt transporter (NicO) family protein